MTDQHILVIDDDDRLRLLLRRFLEESGFRVTDVGSASAARQALQSLVFDVMIVDTRDKPGTGAVPDRHVRDRTPDCRP